ncbi:hypothetical protein SDC9_104420 [bioreactor metagenome]|uniref:Uncharacterized protein n=1 Tax=bioreactor metagenome TaxID=1076179 RepID=A0A645AXV6_9ZZZZ
MNDHVRPGEHPGQGCVGIGRHRLDHGVFFCQQRGQRLGFGEGAVDDGQAADAVAHEIPGHRLRRAARSENYRLRPGGPEAEGFV